MRTWRILTVIAAAALVCGAAPTANPGWGARAPIVAQGVVPAENPRVQAWFKKRETHQIELNNALEAARDLTGPSPQTTRVCTRVAGAAFELLSGEPAPEPELRGPVNAGLVQFRAAAKACLEGDLAAMRRLVDEGTALRADALHPVDEILKGEH